MTWLPLGDSPLVVDGYQGLGDNIFQRPFIRAACERHPHVYVCTPWPQLYWDMPDNLHFIRSRSALRAQADNERMYLDEFCDNPPALAEYAKMYYAEEQFNAGDGILTTFGKQLPLGDSSFNFDFSPKPEWLVAADQVKMRLGMSDQEEFTIVMPPAYRVEWKNSSRACHTEYIQIALTQLKYAGYTVISIGNTNPGHEEYVEPHVVGADFCFDRGELNIETIIGLLSLARVCVSGVGMALPMCQALGTPHLCIFGGYVKPSLLYDHDDLDMSRSRYAAPDPFCNCIDGLHADCNKEIPVDVIRSTLTELMESTDV